MVTLASIESRWPLSFRVEDPTSSSTTGYTGTPLWSHELYSGPDNQKVQILYSCTKDDSERIARQFLDEEIIGFDLEWNQFVRNEDPLQKRVGLIQVACEDKIALFHIGLHRGAKPSEVLAPSLSRLIESAKITKSGVNITGDFNRLRQVFDIKPRGGFELSHLHNLITYGGKDFSKCNRKLFKLAEHVKAYLKMPLAKGNVSLKRWDVPLSQDKMKYAAADAYAGFMLFHCMNVQRKVMRPSPPLPVHVEFYTEKGQKPALHLQPFGEDLGVVTVFGFYHPHPTKRPADEKADEVSNEHKDETPVQDAQVQKKRTKAKQAVCPELVETDGSRRLFVELKRCRLQMANDLNLAPFIVAHDSCLTEMSIRCPRTTEELLEIRGIGQGKVDSYGKSLLSVIHETTRRMGAADFPCSFQALSSKGTSQPSSPPSVAKKKTSFSTAENIAKATFQPPPANDLEFMTRPTTLHTGLSMTFDLTHLADADSDEDQFEYPQDYSKRQSGRRCAPEHMVETTAKTRLKRKRL